MSETAPEPTTEPTADTTPADETATVDSTDWKAEARKWEQRAKDNQRAAKEVEAARKAAMTESERAVAEARESAAMEVRNQYGQRLARTEFIAEAAKRNPGYDTAAILDDLNLARYIGDDGEPDSKAIAAAVNRLIPEHNTSTPPPPSFDGGTRQTAPAGASMSDLIRQAAGRG